MVPEQILIRPVLTEKVNAQMEKFGRYTFRVAKGSNKLEIKKAVEEFYNVKVAAVNTIVVPGKAKSRQTKAGVLKGMRGSYKKALVTLVEGDTIDMFSL